LNIFFDYLIPIFKYVAAAYVVFLIALYFLQGFMIFAPYASKAPSLDDFPFKDKTTALVVTSEDGLDITSWMIAPPMAASSAAAGVPQSDALAAFNYTAPPIVIFFHGNATHALYGATRAHGFMNAGYGYVMAEYRGYGGNKGRPSEQPIYSDVRLLIQRVMNDFPDHPIYLYGESIGTGIATQMATEFDIAGLILEAPFASVTALAQATYPFVPVRYLLRHRFENINKIDSINAPLLIIHGENDGIIHPSNAKQLFNQAKDPKTLKIIKNAGHNDLLMYDSMQYSLDFIQKTAN